MSVSRQDHAQRALAALAAQRERLGEPSEDAPADPERVRRACLDAVLRGFDRGVEPDRGALRAAVRYSLDLLAEAVPGRAVEVRVPPYAAVQCVEGPSHTRGTPPNVVETDATTWLRLASGRLTWGEAVSAGGTQASGDRADLSTYLPLL